jgi:hypothetical protein
MNKDSAPFNSEDLNLSQTQGHILPFLSPGSRKVIHDSSLKERVYF